MPARAVRAKSSSELPQDKLSKALNAFNQTVLDVKKKMEGIKMQDLATRYNDRQDYALQFKQCQQELFNGFGGIVLAFNFETQETLDMLKGLAFAESEMLNDIIKN